MDFYQAFLDLVAYCQRHNVLSSDSAIIDELEEITGQDREAIESELF